MLMVAPHGLQRSDRKRLRMFVDDTVMRRTEQDVVQV
jgi:hypothetical protein